MAHEPMHFKTFFPVVTESVVVGHSDYDTEEVVAGHSDSDVKQVLMGFVRLPELDWKPNDYAPVRLANLIGAYWVGYGCGPA